MLENVLYGRPVHRVPSGFNMDSITGVREKAIPITAAGIVAAAAGPWFRWIA